MRQAMGVAVFAGMIGVTLFGLFLTPVFYVTVMKLGRKRVPVKNAEPEVSVVTRVLQGRIMGWVGNPDPCILEIC